jgi:hypothetical protein
MGTVRGDARAEKRAILVHSTPSGEADDGDRTRDPQLGKLMLYQLSYVREAGSG